MDKIEVGQLYNIKGKKYWKSYSENVYVIGKSNYSIVDLDSDAATQVMEFFSTTYGLDETTYNSMVVNANTSILKCYNLQGMSDFPETYDDPARITHIPECIINLALSSHLVVGEATLFSMKTPLLLKGSLHPSQAIAYTNTIEDLIQNIIPGGNVFVSGSYTMLMSEYELTGLTAKYKEIQQASLDKSKELENQFTALQKVISNRSRAVDSEQSLATSRLAFADSKIADVVVYMNAMTEFLNILKPNYNYEDLLQDAKYDDLKRVLEEIRIGAYFR